MGDYSKYKNCLIFEIGHGKMLVVLKPDGTIEYGNGYTPDECAEAFWDIVKSNNPLKKENEKLREFIHKQGLVGEFYD